VSKSDQKTVQTPKNNIDANDEKCHFMSQLMKERGERSKEISDLIEALRKIGYFQTFHVKQNHSLSGDKLIKTHKRVLKNHNKACYRKIKKYYKSVDKYKTERIRRKLCWLLSGTITYEQIGEFLGISRSTVIRDINKIRPYYMRMFRSYALKLQADRWKETEAKMATMSLFERYSYLSKLIIERREQLAFRKYRCHYTIYTLDMTQADKYGVPKLTIHSHGKTLAFPHKLRVVWIGRYKDKTFSVDIGGQTLTQTRGGW